jgi:hypothetical protein
MNDLKTAKDMFDNYGAPSGLFRNGPYDKTLRVESDEGDIVLFTFDDDGVLIELNVEKQIEENEIEEDDVNEDLEPEGSWSYEQDASGRDVNGGLHQDVINVPYAQVTTHSDPVTPRGFVCRGRFATGGDDTWVSSNTLFDTVRPTKELAYEYAIATFKVQAEVMHTTLLTVEVHTSSEWEWINKHRV